MSLNKLVSTLTIALVCLAITIIATEKIYAVPVFPEVLTLTQADGTTFRARRWGDEWASGEETVTGYTIVFDLTTQNWMYAIHNAEGRLVASDNIVGKNSPPVSVKPFLRPSKSVLNKAILGSEISSADETAQKPVPSVGTGQLPVILINFTDTTTTSHTATDFENLLFGDGNRLTEYYKEVSYGKFSIEGKVAINSEIGSNGWYTANNTHDFYGQPPLPGMKGDKQALKEQLVKEAVMKADADGFNFKPYDTDQDCLVDTVLIIHQGLNEAKTNDPNDIFSQAKWDGPTYFTKDAEEECTTPTDPTITHVGIKRYLLISENLDTNNINTIGIFAHEYGHALGLPDLYDADYSSQGIGNWGLMGFGFWNKVNLDGDLPAHMSAWSKYLLGWIEPTLVDKSNSPLESEKIEAASIAADVYQFEKGKPHFFPTPDEFFLVENRQPIGFDAGLPGSGLAIWHISEDTEYENSDNRNECYPSITLLEKNCSTENHYRVALEQADGLWELEQKIDINPSSEEVEFDRGDADDLYNADSPSDFTNNTTPNSKRCSGYPSGMAVTNISVPDSDYAITADLMLDPNISNITKDIPWGWQWVEMKKAYDIENSGELGSKK